RRLEPRFRHPVLPRLRDHRRVIRVEKQVELRLIEVALVGNARRGFDAIGVVEQHAEIADASDAGFGADGRLAGLDARVAEGALLRLSGLPVVIDLLVRAARDAHAPAATLLLVDQDDAVL